MALFHWRCNTIILENILSILLLYMDSILVLSESEWAGEYVVHGFDFVCVSLVFFVRRSSPSLHLLVGVLCYVYEQSSFFIFFFFFAFNFLLVRSFPSCTFCIEFSLQCALITIIIVFNRGRCRFHKHPVSFRFQCWRDVWYGELVWVWAMRCISL